MPKAIHPREGRSLFGLDPAGYDAVRPDYPDWVYDALSASGALTRGTATVEIGAGNGLATRRLLECGADPLVALEPDRRFSDLLESRLTSSGAAVRFVYATFEDAELGESAWDLIASATAFHWVDQAAGLAKCARLLRPGGHIALWWNVFTDVDKPDPFHDATRALLAALAESPSAGTANLPFALDRDQREADLVDAGFGDVRYRESRWTLTLSTAETGQLYEGFSSIQRLPEGPRNQLLKSLMQIADEQFDGRVERHMTTAWYLARKPG